MNGADDILKYPSKVYGDGSSSRMICIGRPGSTEQVRALLEQPTNANPEAILFLDDVNNEMSSTDARQILRESKNRRERLLHEILHPSEHF